MALSVAGIGIAQAADAPGPGELKDVKVDASAPRPSPSGRDLGPPKYEATLHRLARPVSSSTSSGTYRLGATRWTGTPEPIKEIRGSQFKPRHGASRGGAQRKVGLPHRGGTDRASSCSIERARRRARAGGDRDPDAPKPRLEARGPRRIVRELAGGGEAVRCAEAPRAHPKAAPRPTEAEREAAPPAGVERSRRRRTPARRQPAHRSRPWPSPRRRRRPRMAQVGARRQAADRAARRAPERLQAHHPRLQGRRRRQSAPDPRRGERAATSWPATTSRARCRSRCAT